MKKLIKLSDIHYIIVDDSKIKKGDFVYQQNFERTNNQILKIESDFQARIANDNNGSFTKRKITHSTQPELLGEGWMQSVIPLLLSEAEELIYGYNVEKIAENLWLNPNSQLTSKNSFIQGFKAHQELVKDKLFTTQPLEHLLNLLTYDDSDKKKKINDCKEYIRDLLLPKTEWNIEINEQGKLELV